MPLPLESVSVPERCASGELFCACNEMGNERTAREKRAARRRAVFILSSTPSRAGVGRLSCAEKNAQAADFAGLLAWRCSWLAAFPQRSSGLRGFFKATLAGPTSRARHPPVAALTGSHGCERLPPYSRAAATDCCCPRLDRPTNRLPEHEVCGECGLRNGAAGLG